jgi:hypothetical protein
MRAGVLLVAVALLVGCGSVPDPAQESPPPTATEPMLTLNIQPTATPVSTSRPPTITLMPTATATIRPTPIATSAPRIPTVDPTHRQAQLQPTKAEACYFMEQQSARLGVTYNPNDNPQAIVRDLMRRAGLDPAINSGYNEFVYNAFLEQAIACVVGR